MATLTLIATITFVYSFIGMGVILFRKIPVLVELSEVVERPRKENLIFVLKQKVKEIEFFKNFSYEIFLQKLLSKIRILTLKTENRTSTLLQKLREKQKEKKIIEDDNYWEEIKKSTKKRE